MPQVAPKTAVVAKISISPAKRPAEKVELKVPPVARVQVPKKAVIEEKV